MRDGSPVWSKPDLSVTVLPAAGGEIEVEPVLAGISTGSSEELPVVHGSIPAHICAIIKGISAPPVAPRGPYLSVIAEMVLPSVISSMVPWSAVR